MARTARRDKLSAATTAASQEPGERRELSIALEPAERHDLPKLVDDEPEIDAPPDMPSNVTVMPEPRARKARPATADRRAAMAEISKVADAIREGQISVRGDASRCTGEDAELVHMVNGIVDAMVPPLRVASHAIDQIAHGEIPDFIIDDYPGDFNTIKRNVNTFLATMYGMHHEMQHLVKAIAAGKLNTRGNDWDFEGNWRDMIAGINSTLDAVIDPVAEAKTVLGRMAEYDLTTRVQGRYKGEHAQIKKALNQTASALHDALRQVSASVARVRQSGEEIAQVSKTVAAGAAQQARAIEETSTTLGEIGQGAVRTTDSTAQASMIAGHARESVQQGIEAAGRMIAAMRQIQESAQGSLTVVQEINGIASQTDGLASSAAVQAGHVSEASRGFAVVAKTVRDIADGSAAAARQIEENVKGTAAGATSAGPKAGVTADAGNRTLLDVVHDINRIAMHTNVLAVNAAIEAAHVEATGLGLAQVTEQVRELATRSKQAAQKTESLLQGSAQLSADGCTVSDEIEHQLQELVTAVSEVDALAGRIASDSEDQRHSLELVTQAMVAINDVTQRNATGAQQSFQVAEALVEEGRALDTLVSRFHVQA